MRQPPYHTTARARATPVGMWSFMQRNEAAVADAGWKACNDERRPCGKGEELFYCGTMRYTSMRSLPVMGAMPSEPPLISGLKGTVTGPALEMTGALRVKFDALFGKELDVALKDLSRTKPPPPDATMAILVIVGIVVVVMLLSVIAICFLVSKERREAGQPTPAGERREAGAADEGDVVPIPMAHEAPTMLRHRGAAASAR